MPDNTTLILTCASVIVAVVAGSALVNKFGFFRVGFAAFLIASNFSLATDLPSIFIFKYVRIATTIAFGLWGMWILLQQNQKLGSLGVGWLLFFSIFTAAGLWAVDQELALGFKGLSLCLVIGGLAAGSQCSGIFEVQRRIESIFFAHVAMAIILLGGIIASGGLGALRGRLNLFGMNPIGIGQIASLIIASALCVKLTRLGDWRMSNWALIVFGSLVVLLTGSRGAAAATILMVLVLLSPSIRQSIAPVFLLALAVVLLVLLLPSNIDEGSLNRLTEVSITDRSKFWFANIVGFIESPIIGQGWASTEIFGRTSWGQLHSIYVTILVEAGLLAGIPLLFFLIMLSVRTTRWLLDRAAGGSMERYQQAFCYSIVTWFFFVGLFESGPLTSSTCTLLLVSWAIGTLSSPLNFQGPTQVQYRDGFLPSYQR